jgi:hypothetical protein
VAHVSPDTFIDLLDGTVDESSVAHLSSCAACRDQLAQLRATWQAAAAADMPEPSPLFWEYLSARIHEAVGAEQPVGARSRGLTWSWRFGLVVTAAAATIALAIGLRVARHSDQAQSPGSSTLATMSEPRVELLADDEPLAFVADLASDIDWDNIGEQSLASHGDADLALAGLSDVERLELQRLLREALGQESLL